MQRYTVLIVDDDTNVLTSLKRVARGLRELRLETAKTIDEALERAAATRPDVAIVDLLLGSESGVELVARLKAGWPAMKIAAVSGAASRTLVRAASKAGAEAYLEKPFTIAQVAEVVGAENEAMRAASLCEHASLKRVEWNHIHRVHEDFGGNVSRTARALGISKNTLKKKLAEPRPPQ